MAAWLKIVMGMVPWADVVKAAPSIVSAARDAFAKPAPSVANTDRITPDTPADEAFELVREDIALLRALVGELEADGARKTCLIQTLSERNDRLDDELMALRRRVRAALVLALVSLAVAVAAVSAVLR